MKTPFVITIVGPESSGKTTLARELAAGIGCSWVPELARSFLTALHRPYQFDDLVQLAQEQHAVIQTALDQWSDNHIAIADTITHSLYQQEELHVHQFIEILRPYGNAILIIDSGMLTLQQWASIKFQQPIEIVEQALALDPTSLYLLTRAKKIWEPDPLREAPHFIERVWIYNQYLQALASRTTPYFVVNEEVIQVSTDLMS